MNLLDKQYTDVFALFDDWKNYDDIKLVMDKLGLAIETDKEIYAKQVGDLKRAQMLYPDAPLNIAYGAIISGKADVPNFIIPKFTEQEIPEVSRGLGDSIAKITHATGLDKLAHLYTHLTGKPCHCSERQEALNKLIPYGIVEHE